MPDAASKAEVLRSLGRLVRGLSALFWGLPLSILVCVKTAVSEWLRPLGILPPFLVTALLFYGLHQLSYFQRKERVWRHALDRAQILSVVNIGLSPFIYWWNKLPQVNFYFFAVAVLLLSALLFLFNLNHVLQRLVAMLPDETLRIETKLFTTMNIYLLALLFGAVTLYLILQQVDTLPLFVINLLRFLEFARQWLLIFLILLPVAMTMTLIWKIKEVVLSSVFGAQEPI
jgi:hypothetical protein